MFLCITGVDGSGKTTQISLLNSFFNQQGREIFISKAYGDEERKLFSILAEEYDHLSIMFLFQAFHVQQRRRVERALLENKVVIADRWDESYLSYHSQTSPLVDKPELKEELNQLAFGGLIPEKTFWLVISEKTARTRRYQRANEDYFDNQNDSYFQMMSRGYQKIAEARGWQIIDGELSEETIHSQIIQRLGLD